MKVLLHYTVSWLIRLIVDLLCSVDARCVRSLPKNGPFIVVTNHINFLEVPVLYTRLIPRRVAALVKAENWNNPLLAFLGNLWNGIHIFGRSDLVYRPIDTMLHDIEVLAKYDTARITLDFYGAKEFHGFVEAISPASGAAFSLLPPENATGNWVKVTQRIPVRIRLEIGSEISPLHIGASASVRIDTTTKTASERS